MKYTKTTVAGTYEILAADDFVALPATISSDNIVLAGTPINASGVPTTAGTNAVGILLYDVNPAENPNGAIVVAGVIDVAKASAHSGISSYPVATLKTNVPGVVCRS